MDGHHKEFEYGYCNTVQNTARLRCHESGAWSEAALHSPRYLDEAGGACSGGFSLLWRSIQQIGGAKSVFSTQNRAADEFEERPWHILSWAEEAEQEGSWGRLLAAFFVRSSEDRFWEEEKYSHVKLKPKEGRKMPCSWLAHTHTRTRQTSSDIIRLVHIHADLYKGRTLQSHADGMFSVVQLTYALPWNYWGGSGFGYFNILNSRLLPVIDPKRGSLIETKLYQSSDKQQKLFKCPESALQWSSRVHF